VPIPEVIISIIKWHLACIAEQGDEDSSSPARPESRYGAPTSAAGYGSGTQSGRATGTEPEASLLKIIRRAGNRA